MSLIEVPRAVRVVALAGGGGEGGHDDRRPPFGTWGFVLRVVGHGVEHAAEGVELPLVVGAIAADPRVDLGQRLGAEAVVAKAPLGALADEAGALQDRELLAHGGLRDVERGDEIGDAALAERERVEERAPRGARDRLKDALVARAP